MRARKDDQREAPGITEGVSATAGRRTLRRRALRRTMAARKAVTSLAALC
jgi:hypothetical protein